MASASKSASGTTSAHAENTLGFEEAGLRSRNYLRARGEYEAEAVNELQAMELPPRTRRIPRVS